MAVRHPDHASEQRYIEEAKDAQDARRSRLADGASAAADKFTARKMREHALKRLAEDIDPETLCFGRIEGGALALPTLYVGRESIRNAENKVLVINWRADAAAPFYKATAKEPLGITRRRRLRLDGIQLQQIVDEVLQAGAHEPPLETGQSDGVEHVPPELVDAILDDMERARSSEMRGIVSTIEAQQYELISDSIEGLLIVQGGPGTGKTAIGLHRAAWLIYNHREELERSRVLIVGPNRAFMEYVRNVLPSLGETAVDQRSVDALHGASDVRVRSRDTVEVAKLKGDPRMAQVVERAVWGRVRSVEKPVAVRVLESDHRIPADVVNAVIADARKSPGAYLRLRDQFRSRFAAAAAAHLKARGGRFSSTEAQHTIVSDLATAQPTIEALWPAVSATEVVRELLSNRRLMARASEGILSDDERDLLQRRRTKRLLDEPWTSADIALIDEAQTHLVRDQTRFGYVIVDEAQDLSPMQLRMIARRTTDGRATLVGDLAQATAPWRHRSWEEVGAYVGALDKIRVRELKLGYRVPRQVMEIAGPLVARIADDLSVPTAVRLGPEDPRLVKCDEDDLLESVEAEVWKRHDKEQSLGVIAPDRVIEPLRATLRNAGLPVGDVVSDGLSEPVTLLTADAAKGLEFDHVVVVEPAAIAGEAQDWAKLYVALTRATRTLSVIHTTEQTIPDEVVISPEIELEPVATTQPQPSSADHLGPRYTEALIRAKFVHARQSRLGTGVPYLAHLMSASSLVLEDGGSEDEAIAALLHDAIEDHEVESFERIADQFGLRVAEIVVGCTDPEMDGSWREMKTEHMALLEQSGPLVRRVALAEKLDNARALLRDYRKVGPLLWQRMEVNHEDLLWYLEALADLFTTERPGDMASELRDTVNRLLDAVTAA